MIRSDSLGHGTLGQNKLRAFGTRFRSSESTKIAELSTKKKRVRGLRSATNTRFNTSYPSQCMLSLSVPKSTTAAPTNGLAHIYLPVRSRLGQNHMPPFAPNHGCFRVDILRRLRERTLRIRDIPVK